MIKKHIYEAPDAELLVVRFEENFCGDSTGIPNITDPDDDSEDWG